MGKKDKSTKKGKEHIGLADLAPVLTTLVLMAEPASSDPGTNSALDRLGYIGGDLDTGTWTVPGNPDAGVVGDLKLAALDTVDNLLTFDGLVLTGIGFGVRHLAKHSSLSRKTLMTTKHHRFTAGS
jgi:hypothetical protein